MMEERKKLTIVMAFLNEGNEPRNTINSIIATAPKDLYTIIAVDDCTNPLLDNLSDFENVRYIRNGTRIGSQASKTLGVKNATTPYVLVTDAHMRFNKDDWCQKIISSLEKEPQTAFCTTCLNISLQNSSKKKNFKRYGATISMFNPNRDGHEAIIEANWIKRKNIFKNKYEIPCLLGAAYGFSREFFMKIKGLEGLSMWGSSDPFLSLKVWLAGGKCKILTNVEIGHLFREQSPYRTSNYHLIYNKIYLCKILLPIKLSNRIINCIPRTLQFKAAMLLITNNFKEINEARKYFQSINSLNAYEYFKKFNIPLP